MRLPEYRVSEHWVNPPVMKRRETNEDIHGYNDSDIIFILDSHSLEVFYRALSDKFSHSKMQIMINDNPRNVWNYLALPEKLFDLIDLKNSTGKAIDWYIILDVDRLPLPYLSEAILLCERDPNRKYGADYYLFYR